MATLTDFRTHVSSILGGLSVLDAADLALIDSWVNEGYQDVVMKTGCYTRITDTVLTAGQEDYTISQSIYKVLNLTLSSGGTMYELERVTVPELLDLRRIGDSGAPYCYATAGANLLLLYPTPTSSDDSIRLTYVPAPVPLSAGGDVPLNVPGEWHKLIEFYALFRAADSDDDITSQQGERYKKLYDEGIKDFRRVINQQGGYRAAPARLRRRRRFISNDPSRSWH